MPANSPISTPLKSGAVHGDHLVPDAAMNRPFPSYRTGCTEGGEQGQQVLIAGLGPLGIGDDQGCGTHRPQP